MDKRARAVVLVAMLASTLAAGAKAVEPAADGTREAGAANRPNVVVIMSDDQEAASMRFMPITSRLVGGAGARFANSFVNFPLCCPSRATFLTGQYAHNHGVLSNERPAGGFRRLDTRQTLPLWLRQVGYHTAMVGKFMNGYQRSKARVPRGWSEWHGALRANFYYGFKLYENGRGVEYGARRQNPDRPLDPRTYSTDVYTSKAVRIVHEQAAQPGPFFLWLNYLAPHEGHPDPRRSRCHGTAKPAARHFGTLRGKRPPRPPSFNERGIADKPRSIRRKRPLGTREVARVTRHYRCRVESLQAVDQGVGSLLTALSRTGQLDDTLVVYTSDNGFLLGQHRITGGKDRLYEEAIRVPLMMRGPGIPPGTRVRELVVNADLTRTVLDAARAKARITQDGRSLFPVVRNPRLERGRALSIEGQRYSAIRTQRYILARHTGGRAADEIELYDLARDPFQMHSVDDARAYRDVRAALEEHLRRLRNCAGGGCLKTAQASLAFAARPPARPGACPRGPIFARIAGSDADRVVSAEFRIGKRRDDDRSAPFRERVPTRLLTRGPLAVGLTASLLDGRRVVDRRVIGPCAVG